MSKNLILFSGGVESTALLSISNKSDIIVTFSPPFKDVLPSNYSVEKICEELGREYFTFEISAPTTSSEVFFVHQLNWLVLGASLMVYRDYSITEVWCGRHSKDLTPELMPYVDRLMSVWDTLHPNVKFSHPLDHLSKQEQFNLIPSKIRPYVSSCVAGINCGVCNKCIEFQSMISLKNISTKATHIM